MKVIISHIEIYKKVNVKLLDDKNEKMGNGVNLKSYSEDKSDKSRCCKK